MNNVTVEVGNDTVGRISIGYGLPIVFIGRPCAIESRAHIFEMMERIGGICSRVGIQWIFKSSYDKDCRSSPNSFHGLGLEAGLEILKLARQELTRPR